MVGLVRPRHFSMAFSVHSTPGFYDLVVWGSEMLPLYIQIKFIAVIQMDSWDCHWGHTHGQEDKPGPFTKIPFRKTPALHLW